MSLGLDARGLDAAFPFHIGFGASLEISQVGPSLARLFPEFAVGARLDALVELKSPHIPMESARLRTARNTLFVLEHHASGVTLRGQILYSEADCIFWFLGSPWAQRGDDLVRFGICASDYAAHDATLEHLFLQHTRDATVADAQRILEGVQEASIERRRRQDAERVLEDELHASGDFRLRTDREGKVLAIRAAPGLTIFGVTPEEGLGRPLSEVCPELALALAPELDALFERDVHVAFECEAGRASAPVFLDCRASATGAGDAVVIGRNVTERRLLERQLRHQAMHDSLTGLPNRTLLQQRLDRTLRSIDRAGEPRDAALLFIDLDGFKSVNDIMGHTVGDELLQTVARRIQSHLRPDDIAARLGGDEFAVLLDHMTHSSQALEIAHRLRDAIQRRARLSEVEIRPRCSIGIALTRGAEDTEALFRRADLAMYRAKSEGKSSVELFDDDLQRSAEKRLQLKRDLELALDRDELVLHYQPIVDLHTSELVGTEALVRWQHPERGLLGPNEFIGLAEETGIIDELGRRILHLACHQGAHWQRVALLHTPLTLSVNLSAKQLRGPDIVDAVLTEIRASGIEPSALTLEITESHVLSNIEESIRILEHLRDLGPRVAMDDFGTGYSSLSYLEQLPIDVLKIDKAFVDRLEGDRPATLAEAVVGLGLALGMRVIAEGIEQACQAERLRMLGCRLGQGYLYSPPVDPSVLTEWIEAAAPRRPLIGAKAEPDEV
jgi:diguanylate cyclase (GGDEF)-like protein